MTWVLISCYPSSPSPFPGKMAGSPEGIPFCWVLPTQKRGIQGSGMGHLASPGRPSPRHRARTSRNRSLFSFPLFFSQLLRKTCPKNNPQQPSHPNLLMFGP